MRVILGVDGILTDFWSGVHRWLSSVGAPAPLPHEVTTSEVLELLSPIARAVFEDALSMPRFWRELPVMPEACEGVRALRARGCDVAFLVSPWPSCEAYEKTRRAWLAEHFGAPSRDVMVAGRTDLLAGDALIHDQPREVVAWARSNAKRAHTACLFDAPYNQGWPELRRVTWPRLMELGLD
ncbi:MAG: hypothetical protein AB2A00_30240 [Myxococcota bacterium]